MPSSFIYLFLSNTNLLSDLTMCFNSVHGLTAFKLADFFVFSNTSTICSHQGHNLWGQGSGPQHYYWPPILDWAFQTGVRFNSFVLNVFLCFLWKFDFFSRLPFQLHTRLNDLKFEIPKKIWRAHWAPPQTSPSLFLWLRPRFELRTIRTPNVWSAVAPLVVTHSN